jgi:hypothetical protein
MQQTKTLKTYQVFANVQLPISINVEASNENEAKAIAQYQLYDFNIVHSNLTLIKATGESISPVVHDCHIDVDEVLED